MSVHLLRETFPGLAPDADPPEDIVDTAVPGIAIWGHRRADGAGIAWVLTHARSGKAFTFSASKGAAAGLVDLELAHRVARALGRVADGRGRIDWRRDIDQLQRERAPRFAIYFLNGLIPITEVPKDALGKLSGLDLEHRLKMLEDGSWADLHGVRARGAP